MQQYDFHIQHRPGKLHGNADALSRPCLNTCKHCDRLDTQEASLCERAMSDCSSSLDEIAGLKVHLKTDHYVGVTRLDEATDSSIQLSDIDIQRAQEEDDEI